MARGTAGENNDPSTGACPMTWAIGCAGRSGDADDKPPDMTITTYGRRRGGVGPD
jgi:hypothetical protein